MEENMAVLWSNDLVVGQEILHVYKEVCVMWLSLLCNSIQKMFCQPGVSCKMDVRVGT